MPCTGSVWLPWSGGSPLRLEIVVGAQPLTKRMKETDVRRKQVVFMANYILSIGLRIRVKADKLILDYFRRV